MDCGGFLHSVPRTSLQVERTHMLETVCSRWGIPAHAVPFLDVPIEGDTGHFLSPLAMMRNAPAQQVVSQMLMSAGAYFAALAIASRAGTGAWRVATRVRWLGEVDSVHLGYSHGTGGSRFDARLQSSFRWAAQTMARSGDAQLDCMTILAVIPGVGPDLASDVIASLCMDDLCRFTEECVALIQKRFDTRVPTELTRVRAWHKSCDSWATREYPLPYLNGKHIVLVPKAAVAERISLPLEKCLKALRIVAGDGLLELPDFPDIPTGDHRKRLLFRAICANAEARRVIRETLLRGSVAGSHGL